MNEQNANTVKGTIVNDGSFFCMFITDSVFKLFLLSGRDWTRMALDFDSGKEQELTVFCGVWTDRNSTYFVDDFSLNMIK